MDLRTLILNSEDKPLTPVEVPEWKATVYLRPWSAAERLEFAQMSDEQKKALPAYLALCVCDEDGSEVFSEDDVPALMKKNGKVLERLCEAILQTNGLSTDSLEDAKKNLPTTTSCDSVSD